MSLQWVDDFINKILCKFSQNRQNGGLNCGLLMISFFWKESIFMNNEKIANYIALKRKEKKLSQNELAELVGVSAKTISKWECGSSFPSRNVLDDLCNALGITVNELLNGGPSNSVLTDEEAKILINLTYENQNRSLFEIKWMCFFMVLMSIFFVPILTSISDAVANTSIDYVSLLGSLFLISFLFVVFYEFVIVKVMKYGENLIKKDLDKKRKR